MTSFKMIGLQVLEKKIIKCFTIYECGGHLGHLTWIIYTNFCTPFQRKLQIKFGSDWWRSSGSGELKTKGPVFVCLIGCFKSTVKTEVMMGWLSDNCPTLISATGRMAIEIFQDQIFMEECAVMGIDSHPLASEGASLLTDLLHPVRGPVVL